MEVVVAAGHESTAKACADMLHAGGNAFDAAMAGMAASCIPETILSSLGGGGFMMAYRADRDETVLYDFFAQTPRRKRPTSELDFQAIHADFGPATQEFHIGAGASATPGAIPGLFAIHRDLCTLPLAQILEPAIDLARNGVKVNDFHAYLFEVIEPILTGDAAVKALFAPGNSLLKKNDLFRNEALAHTLEALIAQGEPFFRTGDLAKAIIAQSAQQGGHLCAADLTSYKVERRQPLTQTYRDQQFFLNPAPCAGGPMIGFALGMLAHLCPDRVPDLCDLVQTMSLTNHARSAKTAPLEHFANDKHIAQHLAEAQDHHPSHKGTTHISIIDSTGNAAALTISNGEGNGLMLGDTGIMLNNMLGEEDLHDEGFHRWQEDQRLSSMMAPTIIKSPDNSLTALGSGGSNRIRSAILQVASGLIDHGYSLENAIDAPRLHCEQGGLVSFENTPETASFTPIAKQELLAAYPDAHGWPGQNMFFGGVHGVRKMPSGECEGKGDLRRAGIAIKIDSSL
ncbi:MAG: gamma-glutamyltransferase [bacterium]|nr:gamma-glutamyltransferase [bacterium]